MSGSAATDPFAQLDATPPAPTNDNSAAPPTGFTSVIDVGPPATPGTTYDPNAPQGTPGSQTAPSLVGAPTSTGQQAAPITERQEFSEAMKNLAGEPLPPVKTVPVPAAQSTAPRAAPIAPADPFTQVDHMAVPTPAAASVAPPTPAQATPQTPPGTPPIHPMLQQELRNQPWYQPIQDAIQTVTGGAENLQHHLSWGADEILDPLIPAIGKSLVQGIPFTQAYDQAVAERRVTRQQYEALHPTAAMITGTIGDVPPAIASSPLFAAAPAAGVVGRGINLARNVAAGAGVGAATGFGMTDGNLGQRIQGAEAGAETGGLLQATVPPIANVVGKVVTGAVRALTPGAPSKAERIVGNILNETAAGAPAGAPPVRFQPSPIAGAPLDIAQASGSPELAQLVDARNAQNLPNVKRLQSEQAEKLVQHIPGGPVTNVAPENAAARGSARYSRGVGSAMDISNTEEKRVWNTKALTDKNMTSQSSKVRMDQMVGEIERDTPGLYDALQNSSLLRGIIRDLTAMPEKVAANELNSIASRFKSVGRDPNQDANVKLVAKKLAGAAHDGLWNAPEVTGRPAYVIPGTPARIEMHTLPDGAVVPVHIAAGPSTTIPAIKPIPALAKDLDAARAFTKGEAETFGHAAFDNIVARNSYGNATVNPGTAANRFFDFTTGTEKPGGEIQDVTRFLNDIKSEWLKLNQLGTKYDPSGVRMAQHEIEEGLREYLSAKFLSAVSSTAVDLKGNQSIGMAKASDWLSNNMDLLQRTGIYNPAQMQAWKEVGDYARMVNRGTNLGRAMGSPTFTRLTSEAKWLKIFMNPIMSGVVGTGLGAALGAAGGAFGGGGEAGLGILLGGLEGGGIGGVGSQILRAMYNSSREKALTLLDQAINDPKIAEDLMRKASSRVGFSPETKRWLRSWLSTTGGRNAPTNPTYQPEAAQ
jgi:hypothetical protein